MKGALKVWLRNEAEIEAAIAQGEEVEVVESAYGANEFILDFLKDSGLWDILTQMKPAMKKDNGYPSPVILGTVVMKELLSIGKLAGMGKVITDGKLMADLGFSLERIKAAKAAQKGLIDLGTIRNHLKRIPRAESANALYGHVGLLRAKRWIRGHQYVADAVELEVPYGEDFEGMGRVWNPKRHCYLFGYKLELLMNVTSTGRLRFIGAALGPINADERTLLEEIFGALETHLGQGKIKEIIGTLTLDRGYWGAGFLWKLTHVWGVDFVTLVRDHGLEVAQAVEGYCAALNPAFVPRSMRVSHRGRATRKKVWVCGINALPLRRYGPEARFKDWGEVNVVVLQDEDRHGRPRRRIYVTSLDAERDPFRIVKLYQDRWTIENHGIRHLSQRWHLRDLAGRSLTSIQARIFSVLMLYNAVKILEMKYEGRMEALHQRMQVRGQRSYLSGARLIIYGRRCYYGVFSGVRYAQALAAAAAVTAARRAAEETTEKVAIHTTRQIATELERLLREPDSTTKIAEFIRKLKQD